MKTLKLESLNSDLFKPMPQNEMMLVVGGGKTKITEIIISETGGGTENADTTIKTIKFKKKD